MFSSRNNKAVDVVENRINALGPRPIMLRMGGAFNASHIIPLVEQVLSRLVTKRSVLKPSGMNRNTGKSLPN
ncbi:MAG: hypothetical protein LKE28_02615 [Sphaerochaeta sp.]|nr:hypothetical protein [Sphaerochaeta sp.]